MQTSQHKRPGQRVSSKQPSADRSRVGKLSLDGDAQANLVAHGGVHKAVNAYPAEHYSHWQQHLPHLGMTYGAFGENFTTSGLLEDEVCVGDIFKAGGAIVQISHPRQPCWKLEQRWGVKDFMAQVNKTGRTGWYLRVLQEGYVEAGNALVLVERPFPQWTIARANEVMRNRKTDPFPHGRWPDAQHLRQPGRKIYG